MTVLNLGVVDVPYSGEPVSSKRKRRKVKSGEQTTGDVATILENKYHVMRIFFELHGQEIGDDLAGSLVGAWESLVMGAPSSLAPFGAAESDIKKRFTQFLERKEMDSLGYPGVPTKASLMGVSHRFKNRRGAPGRPSFVDTGQYEATFRSWTD